VAGGQETTASFLRVSLPSATSTNDILDSVQHANFYTNLLLDHLIHKCPSDVRTA
jgi:hypothetical protein